MRSRHAVRRTAVSAELPVKGSVAMLNDAAPLARQACWPGRARCLAAVQAVQLLSSLPSLSSAPPAPAGPPVPETDARHRPGQGRAHSAAVGRRQCRRCRPGDAQCRRNGARRIQFAEHPAPGEGRRRLGRRRAASRAAGARRRRRDHPRAAVRAVGAASSARWRARATFRSSPSRPMPMSPSRGVYLLSFLPESDVDAHRRNTPPRPGSGRSRRSFPTIPMARWWKRRSSRRSRRRGGQIVALEHYPHDKAAHGGAGRGTSRRRSARADALFIPDGGDARAGRRAGAGRGRRQHQATSSCSAPGFGTIRASFRRRRSMAAGIAAPDGAGYRNFASRYARALQAAAGAHRDARL